MRSQFFFGALGITSTWNRDLEHKYSNCSSIVAKILSYRLVKSFLQIKIRNAYKFCFLWRS